MAMLVLTPAWVDDTVTRTGWPATIILLRRDLAKPRRHGRCRISRAQATDPDQDPSPNSR
jgi:hypothetical protein